MVRGRLLLLCLGLGFGLTLFSQKIVYSEPDKDDTQRMDFEIVGKINGKFLIYKKPRSNKHIISVLDNDMLETGKSELDFLPDNDRIINIEFFPYSDFAYMIYQYQKKNVVFCSAVRVDGNGARMGEVMLLDTTHIGFAASNKIYTVQSSEDKSKLIVFKINSRNKRLYLMTTFLYNDKLELLKKSRLTIPMEDRHESLNEFFLDNDGDLVFSRLYRNSGENISRASFIIKYAQADTLHVNPLNIERTWLDEVHVKVDNFNKRYFLTSFYYPQRKGNIEGFYFYIWDKALGKPAVQDTVTLGEELRREAKTTGSNNKMAFNDYFIRNVIIRRDGGFIIGSESFYTSSRFNNWNRWDYLYRYPFLNPVNSYYYSPYYSSYLWTTRWASGQSVRYHADNIAVLAFDRNGNLEWNTVMGKEQYDDNSDNLLSYQVMNTGGELHFLFNQQEKRNNLLNDYSISPQGELTRNPTLKNLDKGHEFMPKYAKQVSARQMIVPCIYRNYICFAKIEYN
ncbi:MAG TPA: hypothetical protein VEB63_11435 [Chitinophagaceae bacterium]|nr:hypothetical protein [Chitinophagaceae bacterium]